MTIKLQLDAPALRALIESSGPEFMMELRKGTVANLANSYRTILSEEVSQAVKDSVKKEFQTAEDKEAYTITETKDNWGRLIKTATLSQKFKEDVKKTAEQAMRDYVSATVNQAFKAAIEKAEVTIAQEVKKAEDQINKKIDQVLQRQLYDKINEYVSTEVTRRFNDALTITSKGE
jgi:hypothetical protein